jgi:hypothetical protein
MFSKWDKEDLEILKYLEEDICISEYQRSMPWINRYGELELTTA